MSAVRVNGNCKWHQLLGRGHDGWTRSSCGKNFRPGAEIVPQSVIEEAESDQVCARCLKKMPARRNR